MTALTLSFPGFAVTAIGAVVTLTDLAVSECAGDCGLDFIWIDAEHGPLIYYRKYRMRNVFPSRKAEAA